ncbi:MAG: RluA family pseudouridine synthase [Bacteroidia bacterium]|nr:RluA family pseudouridine synthase [Bacteroidia bacterium]
MSEQDAEQRDQEELYEHYRFEVDPGQNFLRIDKFLFHKLQHTSRNRIQSAARAGSIIVNQKQVKPSYKVKPGDVISIVLSHPPRELDIIAEDIPLDIVYEDEDIVIVNKKPGMVVHPGYGNYSGTLINALAYHFNPDSLGQKIESDNLRPGLVHRIDKNTSGLLLIAKNEDAMTFLAKQFFERTIDRTYEALVWGDLDDKGRIEGHIGRNLKDRKVMDVFPEGDHGKAAATNYEVLERFTYINHIRCKLETGRTHQIRVHLKYLGHPLFNDETYGGDRVLKGTAFSKYKQFVTNCFSILPRHALHAKSLGFVHPRTKKRMEFDSELPDDIQQVIEKWRKYVAAN